jgi:hypothetical protein
MLRRRYAQTEPDARQLTPEQQVIVEEVQFRNGVDILAGSLHLPRLPSQRPAVALVLVSEAEDRVYEGVGPARRQHFALNSFVCSAGTKSESHKQRVTSTSNLSQNRAEESQAAVRFLRDKTAACGYKENGSRVREKLKSGAQHELMNRIFSI